MISVDPLTYVINICKSDLTLIQATPMEIYNLDLNSFRLSLKDFEDSEDGIYLPKTHNHNTEISLGGITFARVIEILDPYTITFENGSYAVNLVGANSNVGDKVNVNNVSVRSQNSAGLISISDDLLSINRLVGNNITKAGDTITIYEEDGVTVWRQYDISSQGRIQL